MRENGGVDLADRKLYYELCFAQRFLRFYLPHLKPPIFNHSHHFWESFKYMVGAYKRSTIIYKIFETNCSFHGKQRTTRKV